MYSDVTIEAKMRWCDTGKYELRGTLEARMWRGRTVKSWLPVFSTSVTISRAPVEHSQSNYFLIFFYYFFTKPYDVKFIRIVSSRRFEWMVTTYCLV